MNLQTLADNFETIFGGEIAGHQLHHIYEALRAGAEKSDAFTLADEDDVWLVLDDGMSIRPLIRVDKKTYHEGEGYIETFGSLKDCSIGMGTEFTSLYVSLRDRDGGSWVVHITYVGHSTKPHIDMVECAMHNFAYIFGCSNGGFYWTPGEDADDLQRFLSPYVVSPNSITNSRHGRT